MGTTAYHAAWAGLLHDIGKLYQRAYWGLERKPHTAWTEAFVRGLAEIGLPDAEAIAHGASHHHERKPEGWQPDEALSWTVTLADNYASRERECEEQTEGKPPDVPLETVFTRLQLGGASGSERDLGYALAPLSPLAVFPQAKSRLKLDYLELVKRLQTRLQSLEKLRPREFSVWFANLQALLLEVAWAVPSDTQCEPDVSLYDHLRLTSAFAAALWRYHEHEDGTVRPEPLRDEEPPKFLLVQGDLGGIQNHIYRIREAATGTGKIAKRLRARSLEVALATEAMAHELLEALGLPPANRILSAGGRFTLLVQNTAESRSVLETFQERWEQWALDGGATLIPSLAWIAFSPTELKAQSFGNLLKASAEALAEAKLRPFGNAKQLAPTWAGGSASLRPCPVCDALPAQERDGSWTPCTVCTTEEEVGARLPKETALWLYQSDRSSGPAFRFPGVAFALDSGGDYLYRSRFSFEPDPVAFEVRPLTGHVPTVEEAKKVLGEEGRYREWLREKQLEKVFEELGEDTGRPLTFEEIAHFSTGAPYLGVLMLDADRMGEVFIRGLPKKLQTPGRIGALSRLFELFFGFIAVDLIRDPAPYLDLLGRDAAWKKIAERYPLIYGVYAGGDDVFLVGPWDALLHYALDLNALYHRYTAHHSELTLSGGFVLVKPHTPVPVFSDLVQRAEKAAKSAGRGRLTAFGQAVEWPVLEALIGRGLRFYELIRDGVLPRGLGHRLLGLYELYRRWAEPEGEAGPDPEGLKYKPLLFYLRRNEGVEKHWEQFFAPLMNHEDPAMRHLPVWVQYGMYLGR